MPETFAAYQLAARTARKFAITACLLLFNPAVGHAAITDNLIAYWKLDEASGDAIDVHGSNNLTETSGTIASTSGKVGNARDFGGTTDTECFRKSDNADLSTGNIDYTFACWVKADSLSGARIVLGKDSSGQRETGIFYQNNRFRFWVSTNGTNNFEVAADSLGTPNTGTWYFIAGWHDAAGLLPKSWSRCYESLKALEGPRRTLDDDEATEAAQSGADCAEVA